MSCVPTGRHGADSYHSPAAGTGAGGTNYSHGSGYDSGTSVKGYMGNEELLSSGQGYMTTPMGAGPGFGTGNEGSGHNTGIGATGAGTGTTGYHHGKGGTTDVAGTGELSDNKQDAHTLKDILHLRRHHKH